jgi:large subunit ribosomal protein L33
MAKNKEIRIFIILECTKCTKAPLKLFALKSAIGVSRYITQKNRRNDPKRIELKKFCRYCGMHTLHTEIKK